LGVNQPNFKLRALVIGECFNGCAYDKRMAPQDRIPNGLKVSTATRSRGAPDEEIIGSVNHRITRSPAALAGRSIYINFVFFGRKKKSPHWSALEYRPGCEW
jgi:hypothetical protein